MFSVLFKDQFKQGTKSLCSAGRLSWERTARTNKRFEGFMARTPQSLRPKNMSLSGRYQAYTIRSDHVICCNLSLVQGMTFRGKNICSIVDAICFAALKAELTNGNRVASHPRLTCNQCDCTLVEKSAQQPHP